MAQRFTILTGTMTGTAELVADEIAQALMDRGIPAECLSMSDVGIDIFERTRGGMHPDTLWARSFIGEEEDDFSDEDDEDNDEAPLTGNVLDS